ncbi:MAG: flippase-like domain-containing protein [Ignavibacteriae bacterium]|nr:flippase-like domain-containing protein [Ignavibacteriota bacterium]
MIDNLKRNIIIALIFAFVIFLALTFFSDFNSIVSSFRKFPLEIVPLLLLFSLLNLFFRFLKWHFYIRELKIKISFIDSLIVFSSGLVMSVTPGKWGEFLKSFLVKHKTGTAISKTIPIVISERITDIISLIIFAIIGAFIYNYGTTIIYSIALAYLILAIIILNRKIPNKILFLINKIKLLSKYYSKIEQLSENLYKLFKPKIFSITLLYSFASWLFEFFGFYIILRSFTINISVVLTSFIYSFATVIGSLSMLPGGLGATEGSLTFLLVDHGFLNEHAVVATLIIRAVTLWFSEIIGALALLIFSKRENLSLKSIKF